jgi:hypothetical protein
MIAAMSALLGILVTVLAQSLALHRQLAGEEKRVHLGVLPILAGKLEEKRLETHAELCSVLSDALKHIDYSDMFSQVLDLAAFENSISVLDSKHSAFFSAESGERAMELRKQLRIAVREKRSLEEATALEQPEWLRELRHALLGLEVALRVDLGVYNVEYSTVERGFKRYDRASGSITSRPKLKGRHPR